MLLPFENMRQEYFCEYNIAYMLLEEVWRFYDRDLVQGTTSILETVKQ
jgi:hypothetical protein